jgi:GDPmannose 4,6-dehydratase
MNSERDWGFAGDYVRMMWMMMQQDKPDDYVVATGIKRTVRDFVNYSFNELGIDLEWKGEGVKEKGIDKATGKVLVEVDPKYFRPAEVELLIGDPS